MSFNGLGYLAGVLHVRSCSRLHRLCVTAQSTEDLMDQVLLVVECKQVR